MTPSMTMAAIMRLFGSALLPLLAVAGLLFLPFPGQARDKDKDSLAKGKDVYERLCISCHDAGGGHPGTLILAQIRGPEFAIITQRPDLTTDYIKEIVQEGLVEMPPFRPTEISPAELDALANYIIAESEKSAQGGN